MALGPGGNRKKTNLDSQSATDTLNGMSIHSPNPLSALGELYQTVRKLRAPGGCSWDREQTHASLAPCLIEECTEVLEAIDRGDAELMREELGDMILVLFMLGVISEEANAFTLAEAAAEVNAKMIRRHPHVFGDNSEEGLSSEAVLRQWDAIKRSEKGAGSGGDTPFKDLPPRLPATLYAADVVKRMRRSNWASPLANASWEQTPASVTDERTAGAILFAAVAACREHGIDPEGALRRYADQVREAATPPAAKPPVE